MNARCAFLQLFATSKDVSIGPVAVMSLTVSRIIASVNEHHPNVWSGPQIATTVAFICGFIVLGIGLLRLGWLVEFIPAPAVSGFMTGSAISIVAGQVPGLLGESGFKYVHMLFHCSEALLTLVVSTRDATYKVIINCFKFLPATKLDAAFGITGLVSLYLIRIACDYLGARYPRRSKYTPVILAVSFSDTPSVRAIVFLQLSVQECLCDCHPDNRILAVLQRSQEQVGQVSHQDFADGPSRLPARRPSCN